MPIDPVIPVVDPPELVAARKREVATREILDLISRSRDDEAPVFDAILRRAADLCGAHAAALILAKPGDTHQRLAAHYGVDPATVELYDRGQVSMDPNTSTAARAIVTGKVVHVEDQMDTEFYRKGVELFVSIVRDSGIRTEMLVPLLTQGGCIGAFVIFRKEVRPYTADEIALAEAFAAQAVIAIENVRQFRAIQTANVELATRLAREAATREILEVISQSRDDDGPVFEMVVRNAAQLCRAPIALLWLVDPAGRGFVQAASYRDALPSMRDGDFWPADPRGPVSRSIREARVVHTTDLADSDFYRRGDPDYVQLVDTENLRTELSVPLVLDGTGFGAIVLNRRVVDPFDAADITLVETFASQAVIAIENVRQFREVQERLEREKASAEILEVISQSRDDERPVFDAILRNATNLCGAMMGGLNLGRRGDPHMVLAASVGWDDAISGQFKAVPMPMDPAQTFTARSILGREIIHIPDIARSQLYLDGFRPARIIVDEAGARSSLVVPLLQGGEAIGALDLHRRAAEPFTPSQIALVETFAAQAVIAIENVRQFKALEALNAELGDRVQEQVDEIERMGRLKRFLPAAVADAVVSSGSEKMLKSHRVLLGVLFCDIRGFTAFCETAEPEETIDVLQTYHEEMGRLIEAHGAGVDHRMGDGILVLFNDPIPCDDPAGAAVRLGVAMRARMSELCARWKKMGYRLGFGVGISLGYATVGMVGSGGRFDYTASGTAVNLAERLCGEAQDGEILISQRAATAVEDQWLVEHRGERAMKGIREAVAVYNVVGPVL